MESVGKDRKRNPKLSKGWVGFCYAKKKKEEGFSGKDKWKRSERSSWERIGVLGRCGFPGGTGGKESALQCRRHKETWAWSLGWKESLEKKMAIHSSIPAWRIPRTEEPAGLKSMGSRRVGHDWSDLACIHAQRAIGEGLGEELENWSGKVYLDLIVEGLQLSA